MEHPLPLPLGLRANWPQFTLLALLTGFVGLVVGIERVAVPLLGARTFAVATLTTTLAFIVSFGFVKAGLNLLAGRLADHWGRKPLLVLGWVAALPVPFLIIFAPNWDWVVAANVLVGVNQGLAWTMTVTSKIDLVGPHRRGLAMGINEFSGYAGLSLGGFLGAYLAGNFGLRPVPFLLMLGVIVAGLLVSLITVRETAPFAHQEASVGPSACRPSWFAIFRLTSWSDRTLFSVSQAGLIEKFADTLAWGLFPLFFVRHGFSAVAAGILVAVYTTTWAVLQLLTGELSDRIGRKPPIVGGLWLAALGIWVIAATGSVWLWVTGAALMGLGMALLYPTLLAAVSDVAHPAWRATSLGVYRMWRDSGYAFGALAIGVVADHFGLLAGFWFGGAILALSGLVVALLMRETLERAGLDRLFASQPPAADDGSANPCSESGICGDAAAG